MEIGLVSLCKSLATNYVSIVILKDASSGIQQMVNISLCAEIRKIQASNNVSSDGLSSVILAPIHIGSSSNTSSIDDVCGLVQLNFALHTFSVLRSGISNVESFSLSSQQLNNFTTDPSVLSENKVNVRHD